MDMRLEFEGGLCASLLCIKTCDENQDEVNIYTDKQSYRLERERLYTIKRRDGWQRVENLPEYGNSSDHFVEAIKGNRPDPDDPYADPAQRRRTPGTARCFCHAQSGSNRACGGCLIDDT